MSERTVRIVVVDDHTIVRQGVVSLLASYPGFEVVAEAGTGLEALDAVDAARPDVVLLDLSLPDMSGVEVLHNLRERHRDVRVVVLTMHSSPDYARPAIRAGAAGYLVKGSDIGDLVHALRMALAGETFLSPVVARLLMEHAGEPGCGELSPREEEVLRLVAQGKTSREIGMLLEISPRTVDNHRRNIMEKLGVHDVASLTRVAIRSGLVAPE